MIVYKCDICKKDLKSENDSVKAIHVLISEEKDINKQTIMPSDNLIRHTEVCLECVTSIVKHIESISK